MLHYRIFGIGRDFVLKMLFTCGGTGGHIYPAIAIYNEFMKKHKDIEVLFVGSDYGLEKDIMKKEGINIELICSRGVKRSFSISNINAIVKNLIAFKQAKKIMASFNPDIVISTGAYPAFHITYLASIKKIPFYLIESNIVPGLVTRLLAKKATKLLVSSNEILKYLKNPTNVEVVGTPSRLEKTFKPKEQILIELGLMNKEKVITIMGGSCGSEQLNNSIAELIKIQSKEYQIIWATGKIYYERVKNSITQENGVRILEYINCMDEILEITDLIICRAGAMTIQEIKEYQVPAILVPFEQATGNHQYINALELKEAGAAYIIEENQIDGKVLHEKIKDIIKDNHRLPKMKEAYYLFKKNNANERIYEIIIYEMGKVKC